ncbi:hypothetical protein P879_07722 [Paragonimus westermani]|uniref:C2 domain-containing protein n=1 Tax=Paragonimus westermani TaxID=34504 RepID=A0A8T0DBG5_9TREM|nr:hypothetical protein P879_07722 [Paragonimus westermani]
MSSNRLGPRPLKSVSSEGSFSTADIRRGTRVQDSRRRGRNTLNSDITSVDSDSVARSEVSEETGSSSRISPSSSYMIPSTSFSGRAHLLPREGYFWNIKLHLKRSRNLPNTNAKGRIDPYIKIKYRGKTIRRTRIIFNNRNPVWDETIYVPINNLEYPLELRIYNRDVFKKDDYVGRVMFPLRGLMFAMQQEFNVQLEDETGRSIKPYFGELNFSITLNEIPEANVSSDRRQFLLKQLKTDRQTVHHLPRMVPNPDTPTVRPKILFKDYHCLRL